MHVMSIDITYKQTRALDETTILIIHLSLGVMLVTVRVMHCLLGDVVVPVLEDKSFAYPCSIVFIFVPPQQLQKSLCRVEQRNWASPKE